MSSVPLYENIVVIDDDAAFLSLVCRHLKDAGYQVREFSEGLGALEHVLAEPPDLVLADVRMPGLDGFGFLGAMRTQAATAAVPLIFMTSVPDAKAQRKGMNLGADDFLIKPVTRTDLLDTIRARLERAATLRADGARAARGK
jgi:DNA-binding response OmpR family regulator